MSKYRTVNTRYWNDNYVFNLDPSEKLLFVYLLTNEHTNISGIYEIPLRIIAIETGFEKEMVEKIIKRFDKDNRVFYINGWIIVKNFIKHQILNPSVKQGIERELKLIPDKIMAKIREKAQSDPDWVQSVYRLVHLNLNSNLNSNLNLTKPILSAKADEVYSFNKYLDKMLINKQRHIKIIGIYWKYKNYNLDNYEQVRGSIKRDLRPAKNLIHYSDEKIKKTMDYLASNCEIKWTLETVFKYIDENLDNLKYNKRR